MSQATLVHMDGFENEIQRPWPDLLAWEPFQAGIRRVVPMAYEAAYVWARRRH